MLDPVEAHRVLQEIAATETVIVERTHVWGPQRMEINARCTRTGYAFIIRSMDDWRKRRRARQLLLDACCT